MSLGRSAERIRSRRAGRALQGVSVALPTPRRQALPIVQRRPQWGSGRSHSSQDYHRVPRRQIDSSRYHAAGSILDIFLDVTSN